MSFQVTGRKFKDAAQLEKLVKHAARQYNADGYAEDFDDVEVTDPQYDDLYRKLQEVVPDSDAFDGTTPDEEKPTGDTIVLDPPLTSIAKADGDEKKDDLEKWLATAKGNVAMTEKRDGCCARAKYDKKGKLESLALRPRDAINGTDITRHAKYIKGVPLKLAHPYALCLNFEIECHMGDFLVINEAQEEAGEKLYKNPRNYTAGCLGRDDPKENKDALLQATIHGVVAHDNADHFYATEAERMMFVDENLLLDNYVKVLTKKSTDLKGIYTVLQRFEDVVPKLDYYLDGVVLKVNDIETQEAMGHHGDDPIKPSRGAIAWKFAEEVAIATVKELIWEGSRRGRIVPVAIFEEPINLADTDVTRATCNNYGWAMQMGIGPGTQVRVIKAGKIIPKVIGVEAGPISPSQFKKLAPKKCPVFGNKLEVVENPESGNLDLTCEDPNYPPKLFKAWLFYIQTIGGKGIGPSAMMKIMEGGKVKTLPDLYTLGTDDLLNSGFTIRQALLALATIHMIKKPSKIDEHLTMDIMNARREKKKLPGWQFFGALGIPSAGRTAGKALVEKYSSMEAIMDAKDLDTVDGIGDKTAESIYDYFKQNRIMIEDLLKNHIELELPKTGSLTGKNFCLTGSFTKSKKHWEKLITDKGGTIKSSLGKTTHYLVMERGKDDGSVSKKELKAADYGTEVISVPGLEKLLG